MSSGLLSPPAWWQRLPPSLCLGLIMLLALALRCYGLQWGLPNATHPLSTYHPDEVTTLNLAEYLYLGDPRGKNFIYGGTLFYSFLHGIVLVAKWLTPRLTDFSLLEMAILVGRLTMLMFSLATVTLLYAIGKRLFGSNGGLLVALIAALMPALIFWSQRVRSDELAAFLALLMGWLALQVLSSQGRRQVLWLVCAALFSGVLLSYRFPLLVFGLMPLMALLLKQGHHLTLTEAWKLLFPLPFFLYLLLIPLGYLLTSPHSLMYPQILIEGVSIQFDYQASQFADSIGQGPKIIQVWWSMLHQGLGYPFYFLSLAGIGLALRKGESWTLIFATGLLPYLLFLIVTSWVVVRYTLPLLPYLTLFAGYAILQLARWRGLAVATVLTGGLCGVTLVADLAYLRLEHHANVRQEMGQWIEDQLPAGACVTLTRSYVEEVYFNPELAPDRCASLLDMPRGEYSPQEFAGYYLQKFAEDELQYLLLHEYHYANMERLKERHPNPSFAGLYLAMQEQDLELIYSTKTAPRLAGWDFSSWFSAHDLNYVNPGYKLYRLTDASPVADGSEASRTAQ